MLDRNRVTLKDIAKQCGYAVNTVSRAMRGDERLPEETRERIRKIADGMGYIPNHIASSLRSGQSHTVAVIVNDIHNQHYSSLLSEIDECLRKEGYNMMILCMQLDEHLAQQMVLMAISHGVDGILYFPYFANRGHIDMMIRNRMPFVLLDRWIHGVEADTARYDDEDAGYQAGKHLIGLGHEKFLYLSGILNVSSQLERMTGFMRAVDECRIPRENVRNVSWEDSTGALSKGDMSQILLPLDYTALVSFNDELAYHALNAYREMRVSIPQDVSIISFDHIRTYFPYMPPLTSVAAKGENVASVSVRLLMNRIRDPEIPPQIEVLPVMIHDDGTTAKVPERQ